MRKMTPQAIIVAMMEAFLFKDELVLSGVSE